MLGAAEGQQHISHDPKTRVCVQVWDRPEAKERNLSQGWAMDLEGADPAPSAWMGSLPGTLLETPSLLYRRWGPAQPEASPGWWNHSEGGGNWKLQRNRVCRWEAILSSTRQEELQQILMDANIIVMHQSLEWVSRLKNTVNLWRNNRG